MASRKFTGDYDPEYIKGRWRKPPEDEEWTRRYLRDRKIECEGDALQTALDSLDEHQWRRMKNAWRKRQQYRHGSWATYLGLIFNKHQKLGTIWRRLIAWSIITEEEAVVLASKGAGEGHPMFSDGGARFILGVVLRDLVDKIREADKNRDRQHSIRLGDLGACLKLEAQEHGIDETLDDRVIALMERWHRPEFTLKLLAELKASGDYDRILAEVRAEASTDGQSE